MKAVEMSNETPLITVVVATHDRYDLLPQAIESLLAQDISPTELEIVIVDNSSDQSRALDFSKQYSSFSNLRYLLEPTIGVSNARNAGIEASSAEIVAFIDDDAVAAPDWAKSIHAAFSLAGERVAAVGGTVLPRWISERPAWFTDNLLRLLSVNDWGGDFREVSKDFVVGCNLAIRKSVAVELGKFRNELGRRAMLLISNEECEFLERFEAAGYQIFYCPNAVVTHTIQPDRLKATWFRRRAAWQAVSDFIQNEPKAALHGQAATEALRAGFERLFQNQRQHRDNKNPFLVDDEIHLTYALVTAALSGSPVFGDQDR